MGSPGAVPFYIYNRGKGSPGAGWRSSFFYSLLFFCTGTFLLHTPTASTRLDYRPQDTCSSSSLDTPSLDTTSLLALLLPPSLPHTTLHCTPSLSLCRTALTLLGLGPTPHRHRSALRSCLGCNKSKRWVFVCWGNNKQQSVAYTNHTHTA